MHINYENWFIRLRDRHIKELTVEFNDKEKANDFFKEINIGEDYDYSHLEFVFCKDDEVLLTFDKGKVKIDYNLLSFTIINKIIKPLLDSEEYIAVNVNNCEISESERNIGEYLMSGKLNNIKIPTKLYGDMVFTFTFEIPGEIVFK